MISISFSEYDLPNGLHVILSPDKNAAVVATDMWYHVGSKNEEPSRTGFAHLFEHMMFQGSAHVAKAEHMRYIEQAGGTFNGSTTWDRTNYFETLPEGELELALWLESDRMMSLDIGKQNLDNQREVVKEERRWRVDNRPYGTAWEKIFSLAFRVHPYRWPVVGYLDHLNAASVDDVRRFFRVYYAPNNAVLSIAGRFDPAAAKRLVERYFSDIPGGTGIQTSAVAEPQLESEAREIVYDRVGLPAIYLAFRAPSMTSADSAPLNLAASLLSKGRSSRLYRRLVYEKKIAQSVEASQVDMEDPGVFVVNAVVSPGHSTEEVEHSIRQELRTLAAKPPSEKEIEKVKNQFNADWIRHLSRANGRADTLAHFRTFYGETSMINKYLDSLMQVTSKRVSEAAAKYLDTKRCVVINYLPINSK